MVAQTCVQLINHNNYKVHFKSKDLNLQIMITVTFIFCCALLAIALLTIALSAIDPCRICARCLNFPLSRMSPAPVQSLMKVATSKNTRVKRTAFRGICASFCCKFLPACLLVLLADRLLQPAVPEFVGHVAWENLLVGVFSLLLVGVSCSSLHPKSSVQQRSPLRSGCWLALVAALGTAWLARQLAHPADPHTGYWAVFSTVAPWHSHLAVVASLALVLFINESWKSADLHAWNREQRRRRLLYKTKLGMNSPFWARRVWVYWLFNILLIVFRVIWSVLPA